jgi:hypothetical protein
MNDMAAAFGREAEDYLEDLEEQVGFFGIESLTENQRAFYLGYITYEDYMELE